MDEQTKNPTDNSPEALLQRKLERDKQREADKKKRDEEFELLVAEYEEKLEGTHGVDFEIIDARTHFIVLKPGAAVLHTRFMAVVNKDKMTPSDVVTYVTPCVVFPDKDTFKAIIADKPAIATRCANALVTLYGGRADEDRGKF